ncbi:Site-specific recombinase XerD [Lacrimispora sphenoides]|uniref:tyrosine-type recombinase/integrase n=1 Tax=Lacrimispora sphenoides TaxID=29370 RepID=UPI0008BE44F6|nr:tyrosine-type recombinase/integrase [Lacrimispora sphenoides]SEU09306.1 Site-specific recombinase XerD [Lacrimispora sphenoides]
MTYHEQNDIQNIKKLRSIISALPAYCEDFFRGIEPRTSSKTRIAYAGYLRLFFDYLIRSSKATNMESITLDVLENLKVIDFEKYMEWLKCWSDDSGNENTNGEYSLKSKISALRAFYKYLYQNERIKNNVASLVQLPKLHDKEIVRLDSDEMKAFIQVVETGEGLEGRERAFFELTRKRDLAIIMLLLTTGIRVSECVGLDIKDADFKKSGIRIYRKGGKEETVYFSDDAREVLESYIEERKQAEAIKGHENALFLSLQNKRISTRSVEDLIPKYARLAGIQKKVTPHTLRRSYGTALYNATGDIYLVAGTLGHADVNTAKRHYVALEDEKKRENRNAVKLR